MPSAHVVFCRGLVLLTWYIVCRFVEAALLCVVAWQSVGALSNNDNYIVCPRKVTGFVWVILLHCIAKLAACAYDTVQCSRSSEVQYLRRTGGEVVLALLLGLLGQLYVLGACDQQKNNVAQLYVTLQFGTAACLAPSYLAMIWLAQPVSVATPRCRTPRQGAEDALWDAFNGESPVLVLDDE